MSSIRDGKKTDHVFMGEYNMEVYDNEEHVKLTGVMTIEYAREARMLLQDLLVKKDHLCLNLDSVTSIDLSCLQLLCALHKSAMQTGKSVTLEYSPSSVITKALRQAGYIRQTGCAGNKECFWSEASNG
jgi:ABC-type transporter Mla MlaB component